VTLQDALARMPHKGAMLLLERIVEADETMIFCLAHDHSHPDYPLRIEGRLMAVCLVELGAQAAAAHASLYGEGGHRAGLLLALQGVEVLYNDGDCAVGPLEARAQRLYFDDSGARYSFDVRDRTREIVRGVAILKMQAGEV